MNNTVTGRDKRLLSFLVGDLEDASRALHVALNSDFLSPLQRDRLEKSAREVRVLLLRKKKDLNNA